MNGWLSCSLLACYASLHMDEEDLNRLKLGLLASSGTTERVQRDAERLLKRTGENQDAEIFLRTNFPEHCTQLADSLVLAKYPASRPEDQPKDDVDAAGGDNYVEAATVLTCRVKKGGGSERDRNSRPTSSRFRLNGLDAKHTRFADLLGAVSVATGIPQEHVKIINLQQRGGGGDVGAAHQPSRRIRRKQRRQQRASTGPRIGGLMQGKADTPISECAPPLTPRYSTSTTSSSAGALDDILIVDARSQQGPSRKEGGVSGESASAVMRKEAREASQVTDNIWIGGIAAAKDEEGFGKRRGGPPTDIKCADGTRGAKKQSRFSHVLCLSGSECAVHSPLLRRESSGSRVKHGVGGGVGGKREVFVVRNLEDDANADISRHLYSCVRYMCEVLHSNPPDRTRAAAACGLAEGGGPGSEGEEKRRMLVHCQAGASRSVSIVVAYLMFRNHWTLEEAFRYVKGRRKMARPNPGFWDQLRAFEKQYVPARIMR